MVGRSDISLLDLLELGLLKPGQRLQIRRHGGVRVYATVTARGTIMCEGSEFKSPSLAANAIRGTNSNGWMAWRADQDGTMVYLDILRKQARRGH